MAKKVRIDAEDGKAEQRPVREYSSRHIRNPRQRSTMFVLFAEPLIFVLLGAAMAVEYSPLIGIVVAAILMIGPLSTLISDRRSRPEMVTIDNHGLTFEFSDGRRDYAGWNEVRLIPRSRSAPAKRGGFALNSEVGRAYRLSREVLATAAEAYKLRTGRDPW